MLTNFTYGLTAQQIADIKIYIETNLFGLPTNNPYTQMSLMQAVGTINSYLGTIDSTTVYMFPDSIIESVVKPLAVAIMYEASKMNIDVNAKGAVGAMKALREGNETINFAEPKDTFKDWKQIDAYQGDISFYAKFLSKLRSAGTVGGLKIALLAEGD